MRRHILVAEPSELSKLGLVMSLRSGGEYQIHEIECDERMIVIWLIKNSVDLLILDPSGWEDSGLSTIAEIHRLYPGLPILAYTGIEDLGIIDKILKAGVAGFVPKTAPIEDFENAVQNLLENRNFVHPDTSHKVLQRLYKQKRPESQERVLLTKRQQQVLTLIADGKTVAEIAEELGLSKKTIEAHRVILMNKLSIHHVPGLVHYALRHGYVA